MRLKLISMLAISAFAFNAAAEEGFKISGDFASSVFVNSGKDQNPNVPNSSGSIGSATNRENSGDFSVDMAEINVEKTMGDSSVVLGIGYGRIFDYINSTIDGLTGKPKSTLNLTNAYFQHKFGDTGLSFKLGKFEADGYNHETYNYMDNMNYTRSYAFSYMGPFYFTGLEANYMINEMFNVGAVVANTAVSSTDTDSNKTKVAGVKVNAKLMEGLTARVSYLRGEEGALTAPTWLTSLSDTTRLNGTIAYSLDNMYDFAFNYADFTVKPSGGTSAKINSMSLYAGAKMEMFGGGLRYEMVNDKDGFLGSTDNKIKVLTVSAWYNIDQNASLKAEFASSKADAQMFKKDDGAASDSMSAYGLGFLYRF
ncbi:MAG: outer membrane beta-barrel protein [Bdellovibrionaceae bacterium]|nr:outer membrane beta-barrel protein [Pseudobdellovibrionaceae bacterium]